MGKNNEYLEISKQIVANIGGMDNIQGTAHCATRLRIVLKDNDLADIEKLEDIDKVKGAFIAGNQLQLILGAGTVNDVYEVFAEYTNTQNMSLGDLKEESAKRQNPLQAVIKALSDVFIGIMPALLAAALLMGITSVLGGLEVVKTHDTLYAINRLVSLASTGIFAILPMAVCYSAVKRFGGNPVLGMVIGAIMLDSSLANAYQAAQGTVDIEVIRLFGLKSEMVGFQGGIIIALMMGFVVAKLDKFFNKVIPDVIKLLVAPMLTVFISTVLLFTLVGPAGRILSNGITDGLMWSTEHLGAFGYALFAGVQQIVVITGLHHIIGAVEAQLIASTGTNFLLSLLIAIPLGLWAGYKKNGIVDNLISFLSYIGMSIPSFWLGMLLIILFTAELGILPSGGIHTVGNESVTDTIKHLIMPSITLSLGSVATFIRYIRANTISQLAEEYVLTAEAKGTSAFNILRKHVLKNTLLPIITLMGMNLASLVCGSFIIESVFGWPGIGMFAMSAIGQRDYPVIMAYIMLSGFILVSGNLLADILYAFADPRIKRGIDKANGK